MARVSVPVLLCNNNVIFMLGRKLTTFITSYLTGVKTAPRLVLLAKQKVYFITVVISSMFL